MATAEHGHVFLRWVNYKLKSKGVKVVHVKESFRDGVALCQLCEVLNGDKSFSKHRWSRKPKNKIHMLENLQIALDYIKSGGAKLVGIQGSSIHDGNETVILGLLWALILQTQKRDLVGCGSPTQGRRGSGHLTNWCRAMTAGHKRVRIRDMNKSWRNGLGFCALLHHYRPDLMDFDKALLMEKRARLELAFDIASSLGVPRLLEPDDLLVIGLRDRHAVATYLGELKKGLEADERRRVEADAAASVALMAAEKKQAEIEAAAYAARVAAELKARAEAAEKKKKARAEAAEKKKKARAEAAASAASAAAIEAEKREAAAAIEAEKREAAAAIEAEKREAKMLAGKLEAHWGASRAIKAAAWARVFASEAEGDLGDAKAVGGTDYYVVTEGAYVGVYETKKEAERYSDGGRLKYYGFSNFAVARTLAEDLQGGHELWEDNFGDSEGDDDDVDSDSDSEDDEGEDEIPERKADALRAERKARFLVEKGRVVEWLGRRAAAGSASPPPAPPL